MMSTVPLLTDQPEGVALSPRPFESKLSVKTVTSAWAAPLRARMAAAISFLFIFGILVPCHDREPTGCRVPPAFRGAGGLFRCVQARGNSPIGPGAALFHEVGGGHPEWCGMGPFRARRPGKA